MIPIQCFIQSSVTLILRNIIFGKVTILAQFYLAVFVGKSLSLLFLKVQKSAVANAVAKGNTSI